MIYLLFQATKIEKVSIRAKHLLNNSLFFVKPDYFFTNFLMETVFSVDNRII